ncbi:zinc-ribbon domain-containing protein [Pseudarthrobacter sp. B4EP4b]|uniref:zinc-ribbon domain-containing protein n=1 Tax=Pseudarthrobacter sp. B4EP4b TaxID=2590664 RepID=UPI0011537BBE|nr:zinc-ribbon domain-containing protein [Pseudarthrobacter sp. B4EP4b]
MEVTATTVSSATGQLCSTDGCPNAAAYKTRTQPSWCISCIDVILRTGGIVAVDPFEGPKAWRLTECLDCGVQAHYRLVYTIEKNAVGEKTCRACYWKAWAKEARALSGEVFPGRTYSTEEIIAHLDANGFDFIATTGEVTDGYEPVITQCRSCRRISADRMGDIGWGCSCSRNARSTTPTSSTSAATASRNIRSANPARPSTAKMLLADSDDPARGWWDHERNDEKYFRTLTLRAKRECHWVCPDCGHKFREKVLEMTAGRHSCPECKAVRQAAWSEEYERWKLTPVADVPALAGAWADETDPRTVMVGGGWELRRFRCPAGHHPRINPLTFLQSGCPSCRGAETRKAQKNWLADTLPEIASQWHPTKNGKITPADVVWDSKRTVWWLADCCGYEWPESPLKRDKYERLRCPQCRTILGSLAWQDPGLAAEWSPANPESAWQVRPNASTQYLPEWICSTNPAHVWSSPLSSRSNGAGCQECREVGKSKVELAHFAAAEDRFPGARSGAILRDKAFTTRKAWSADISAQIGDRLLVVEYDGAHWHKDANQVLGDTRKTTDLLAAGYLVVRLREDDLPSLDIANACYWELRVYSAAPQPQKVMEEISVWLDSLELTSPWGARPSHEL